MTSDDPDETLPATFAMMVALESDKLGRIGCMMSVHVRADRLDSPEETVLKAKQN